VIYSEYAYLTYIYIYIISNGLLVGRHNSCNAKLASPTPRLNAYFEDNSVCVDEHWCKILAPTLLSQ